MERDGYERAGQGMYYSGDYLYAVFSYNPLGSTRYKKNDIAIYKVTENGKTLSTTLQKIYEFDSEAALISDLDLFELEGIAAINGIFYVDTNQSKDGTSSDYIYNIGKLTS